MVTTTHSELMEVLLGAQDLIAPVVAGHGRRVAMFSRMIAEVMDYTPQQLRHIDHAAKLHDIGCFALSIQEKNDLHQFDVLSPQKHCAVGYLLLGRSSLFGTLAPAVLHHHTHYDRRTGNGKDGTPVPHEAFIIHLADRIDILTDDRFSILQQRKAITEAITDGKGTLFHPHVVEAFCEAAYRESFWLRGVHGDRRGMEKQEDTRTLSREELLDFTRMLTLAIDYKSRFTATHSQGVAATCAAMGTMAGLQDDLTLIVAGHLHDLGKLIVPNEILEKKGPLNETERAIMNSHPFYTYSLLSEAAGLARIAMIAGMHQEKLNGKGYPFHPEPDAFPMASRVLAVCDVFTALAENRPYRKGLPKNDVISIMRRMVSEGHLDPQCFAYLTAHYETLDELRRNAQQQAEKEYRGFWNRTEAVMESIA
jgi:HD-GYP domain-containing protein (c-di-GMP phosphodiesterase class II)